ncbi:Abi-alpha family protein [Flavobacterium sp. LHD-85]|uniref:Abi-alpha family protein n=1 Tax=Flavobacterium sp. LHD-85 TaxID=3071410 RepID=UPI0027DF9E6C|nr:Abi-alpha family protein [Flavobacterium sp. LHD-85]MDQ6530297.1 Abi-alpha family protein [Flavobacterium sp. LHD-85]
MTGLEKIATDEAIKAVAEKSESLIKSLFGKAFNETGEMIADQVKLRRFKNQVSIFEKAEKYLKDKNIDVLKVNLKVLAPMLEFSSYEEDKNLQELWAKLITNILSKPTSILLQQNSIEILNKISNVEAKILNHVHQKLRLERQKRCNRENDTERLFYDNNKNVKPEDLRLDWFTFDISEIGKELNISLDNLETDISNLVALGTLKYDTEVEVTCAEKSSDDPSDTSLDIDLDVSDYTSIRMTKLGYVFVEFCTQ